MYKIVELKMDIQIHEIFHLFKDEEDAVFLDSSLQNHLGQYSIIGLFPYLKLAKGKNFKVNGEVCDCEFETYTKDYLKKNKVKKQKTGLPIISGAIGYFSYDYGRKKMKVHGSEQQTVDIPDVILNFYDVFIIADHVKNKIFLVANGELKDPDCCLRELICKIENSIKSSQIEEKKRIIKVRPNFEKNDYLKAVQDTIDYIIEGDIYIANLTQHLKIESSKKPYDVFCTLREKNPSPFGGYFNGGDFQIVCASPERFLKMKDGHVETRPIKGTRKRGETAKEDALMKEELIHSEKDQSELLMIVDLERNDLNKVCKPGSVKVTELFTIETYATVFHLSANIVGDLQEDKTVLDLIEGTFPGGSITGAPKLRAMEIIDTLEHSRRNLYTGSMGYLTLDGDCDFNIVIRSTLYKDGIYYLGVGGGITYESELEFEYEETLQKAKALLEAMR
ncbi:MAG: aminodeoxychorismate synthase component I [Eubacterium sp.]